MFINMSWSHVPSGQWNHEVFAQELSVNVGNLEHLFVGE